MLSRAASLAAVCVATFAAAPASALVWAVSLQQPQEGHQSFWPEGLKEAVQQPGFIGGEHFVAPTFGSGHEATTLHYRGDAAALNRFLDAYAALDAPRMAVTLHPGVPDLYDVANTKIAPSNPPQLKSYDWTLHISGTCKPEAGQPGALPAADPWELHVSVEVWTGGNIVLDDVRVPPGMTVRAGGEIGAFIRRYEADELRRAATDETE